MAAYGGGGNDCGKRADGGVGDPGLDARRTIASARASRRRSMPTSRAGTNAAAEGEEAILAAVAAWLRAFGER